MGSASYTKGAKRVGGNHEWTRMGNSEPRMDTKGHERKIQNHEWTRMDTNGTTKYRSGTTKHTKHTKNTKNTKKGRGDSMNHERHERIV